MEIFVGDVERDQFVQTLDTLQSFCPSLNQSLDTAKISWSGNCWSENSSALQGTAVCLISELAKLDEDFQDLLVYEIKVKLESMGYIFSAEVRRQSFEFLTALALELQSLLLCRKNEVVREDSNAMDVDEDRSSIEEEGRVAFQLDKICRLLKIDTSSASTKNDILRLIPEAITSLQEQSMTPETFFTSERIFPENLSLASQQQGALQNIEQMLQQDFAIRRQMMLTRFHVTLQSLLGDDDDDTKEAKPETTEEDVPPLQHAPKVSEDMLRLRTAIKAQLQSLSSIPIPYQWEDALAAPQSILYEQCRRVTGDVTRGEAGDIVKKVIVGAVPDRGGRVNELRQKKMFEGGKRFGGGGGGGGGGKHHQQSKNQQPQKGAGDGGEGDKKDKKQSQGSQPQQQQQQQKKGGGDQHQRKKEKR